MVQEQETGVQEQDESRAEQSNAAASSPIAMEVFVKSSQMSEAFQSAAIAITAKALAAYTHTSAIDLKQVATEIKQEYDKQYPSDGKATDGVYYCVVGESFACAVSNEFRQHIWLQWRNLHIVIWKSKDCLFDLTDC